MQVLPLTSNVERVFPSEAVIILNGIPNKAMADHITTVSKTRLGNRLGQVSKADMQKIEQALKVQLDLKP